MDGGGEIVRFSDAGEMRCHDLFSGLMKGLSMTFLCEELELGMEMRCHGLFSGLMKGLSMTFLCEELELGMEMNQLPECPVPARAR